MSPAHLLWLSVATVFSLCAALLIGLLIAKALHHHAMAAHAKRRTAYIGLLSRHLARDDHRVTMGKKVAEDGAFLEAVIDLRNVVGGSDSEDLADLVDRFGITRQQTRYLRNRYRRGKRLRAAVALAELGDESSVSILMEHLSDPEDEIRIQCARGLARTRWTPAIDDIVSRLSVETPWVRARFADTLVSFGAAATWPLLAYIRVNHRFESVGPATAIRTLANIADHAAVVPLLELLQEAIHPEIRIATVEALGPLGGVLALRPLEKEIRSEDWRVRAKAATALGVIKEQRAIPSLVDGIHDPSWWVRKNSARALAEIPEGRDELHRVIVGDDSYARDAAAEALADVGEIHESRQRVREGRGSASDFDLITLTDGTKSVSL